VSNQWLRWLKWSARDYQIALSGSRGRLVGCAVTLDRNRNGEVIATA
jgi:hypothetical protein